MKFPIVFLLAACVFISCSSEIDHSYISSRQWIYESGYQASGTVGLDFTNGSSTLKGDTIYTDGAPVAIVTALYKSDNILKLKSLSGEEGKYLDAVEYTR